MKVIFKLYNKEAGVKYISEPDGWKDSTITLERDPKFYSVNESFKTSMRAYGDNGSNDGGRDWFKMVRDLYGPNAIIELTILFVPYDFKPQQLLFEGQTPIIMMKEILREKVGHVIELGFTAAGFWSTFLSGFSKPVDILSANDLKGNPLTVLTPFDITLASQVIKYTFNGFLENGWEYEAPDAINPGDYLAITLDTADIDEFQDLEKDEGFQYTFNGDYGSEVPAFVFSAPYKGKYTFKDFQFIMSHVIDNLNIYSMNLFGAPDDVLVTMWVKVFRPTTNTLIVAPIQLPYTHDSAPFQTEAVGDPITVDAGYTKYTLDLNFFLEKSDEVTIYGQYSDDADDASFGSVNYLWGKTYNHFQGVDRNGLDGIPVPSKGIIEGETVYPATTSPGFLIHDAGAAITDRILGGDGNFYSERLGNLKTSRNYGVIGADSYYVTIKGLHLRGYTLAEKQFFMSMEEWWEGLDPILNLGLGFEKKTIGGVDKYVITVEEKAKFFDSSMLSVVFINVRNIERTYDQELYFNAIENGYDKKEDENFSNIDDPQTKRTWLNVFTGIGKKIPLVSSMIAASLTIESARRTSIKKAKDYKFDNDPFIVSVVDDGFGLKPRINEGFSDVSNLLNEDTRYNKVLTPARNLLRWGNYLCACLQQYLTSFIFFSEGTGNYKMVSTMADNGQPESFSGNPLAENGSVPITAAPLFWAEPYRFERHPLTNEAFAYMILHKKLAIGVSQTESNITPFFIKKMEFKPFEGTCDVEAWPKKPFDINKVDNQSAPPSSYIFDSSFERGPGGFNETN